MLHEPTKVVPTRRPTRELETGIRSGLVRSGFWGWAAFLFGSRLGLVGRCSGLGWVVVRFGFGFKGDGLCRPSFKPWVRPGSGQGFPRFIRAHFYTISDVQAMEMKLSTRERDK